jgi:hypothetical protein
VSSLSPAEPTSRHRGVALTGIALLVVLLAAALSLDLPGVAYKVKSDEATYVAMTLSAAYDGNLSYERRDLERFWGLYQQGPEGIFLKRGKQLRLDLTKSPPFIRTLKAEDAQRERLYFAKSMAYAVVAAPFVRLFGLNGFYVFHVLLLGAMAWCGYRFLAATSERSAALGFSLAFLAASVLPLYGVFMMPDLFNAALIFVAYFLWLYKEVGVPQSTLLRSRWSDVIAAVLIAVATYSKPTNVPLIAPLGLLMLYRRQWRHAVIAGAVFAIATGALFGWNAAVTGEFNYQGGDRKTFYGSFPYESSRDVWAEKVDLTTTNDADTGNVLETSGLTGRVLNNMTFFAVGRHFGFVPYFFPGLVALLALALSPKRLEFFRVVVVVGALAAILLLLLFLPYSWSGGGGPPGNRYFLSIYPVLLFVIPAVRSWHAVLAFAGGALFTAKILMNPFASAKNTWEIAEHGFQRMLPVEVTMANDLPVMLAQPPRGRIPYRYGEEVLLYFLDRNAFPPEPVGTTADGSPIFGMWVAATGRADVIVRTDFLFRTLQIEADSPIATDLSVSIGGATVHVPLVPGKVASFSVPASATPGWRDYNYLLHARTSAGFVPRLLDPKSSDNRYLGANLRLSPVR